MASKDQEECDQDQQSLLYDVIVVGGSYAGLSVALTLARCNRRVLVVDESGSTGDSSRNYAAKVVHGFLTHPDPVSPRELLQRAVKQVSAYPNASLMKGVVTSVDKVAFTIDRIDVTEDMEKMMEERKSQQDSDRMMEPQRLRKPFMFSRIRETPSSAGQRKAWDPKREGRDPTFRNGFEVTIARGSPSDSAKTGKENTDTCDEDNAKKKDGDGDERGESDVIRLYAQKIVFATGVKDICPREIPQFDRFYGNGIWHCALCDGYVYTNEPIGVYGMNGATESAAELAIEILIWTDKVILFTNETKIPKKVKKMLDRHPEIMVVPNKIVDLIGEEKSGQLKEVVVDEPADEDGTSSQRKSIPCVALFFNTGRKQTPSVNFGGLGCKMNEKGDIVCDETGVAAGVPGIYFAGNATTRRLMMVASAVGNGATVGFQVNSDFLKEDMRRDMNFLGDEDSDKSGAWWGAVRRWLNF